MIRKYTTKSGEVKVYNYNKSSKTNAQNKRDFLIKFIDEHKSDLNKLAKKKDKIEYIINNIGTYNYSYSTVNRYI